MTDSWQSKERERIRKQKEAKRMAIVKEAGTVCSQRWVLCLCA